MNKDNTYTQIKKRIIRKEVLNESICLLTNKRYTTTCVRFDYPRNVIEYFLEQEGEIFNEVKEIDNKILIEWENFYNSIIKYKSISELKVCYLSGPQPSNDFNEFISFGILPQNIYAFEMDQETYNDALGDSGEYNFSQPKIIYQNIEKFFKDTPMKFDIIYLDGCKAILSSKNLLRCFATLCKYHRLYSPGVVITNFASLYGANSNLVSSDMKEYIDIMSLYFYCKESQYDELLFADGEYSSPILLRIKKEITQDFDLWYGNFITSIIRDISSVIIPTARFVNSDFANRIYLSRVKPIKFNLSLEEVNKINNNSIYKFLSLHGFYKMNHVQGSKIIKKFDKIIMQLSGIDDYKIDLFTCFKTIYDTKQGTIKLKDELDKIGDFFESEKVFRFLDRPNKGIYFDLLLNQIGYPLHYVTDQLKRYKYKAKETNMFTDVFVFDECRYLYDWLPSLEQTKSAFENKSIQYIFRFALDGLIKNRIENNNESFFQGSVMCQGEKGFESKKLKERVKI